MILSEFRCNRNHENELNATIKSTFEKKGLVNINSQFENNYFLGSNMNFETKEGRKEFKPQETKNRFFSPKKTSKIKLKNNTRNYNIEDEENIEIKNNIIELNTKFNYSLPKNLKLKVNQPSFLFIK